MVAVSPVKTADTQSSNEKPFNGLKIKPTIIFLTRQAHEVDMQIEYCPLKPTGCGCITPNLAHECKHRQKIIPRKCVADFLIPHPCGTRISPRFRATTLTLECFLLGIYLALFMPKSHENDDCPYPTFNPNTAL